MRYLIGIDLGTSGTKAVLFEETGRKAASYTAEYPMSQPKNGWAEQDPADWWEACCQGIQSVITQAGIEPDRIAGVGLSGQMHGLVMLGESGEVLRPSIIWCDQRTGAECEHMTEKLGREKLIRITANPAMTGFTASKILWVKRNEPKIYDKCRKILLPKDYIRFRLTGELATDISDASGMQLVDIAGRCWSDEVLEALEIQKSLLGRIYESCEVTGQVSAKGALESGLAKGTLVVGGAGDNFAAAVGTGTVSQGRAFTTIGTSGVVFAHSDSVSIDPRGRVHTFCSAVPGKWCVMSCTQAAGLSLRWLRDTVCSREKETADTAGRDPYEIMDHLAEAVPAGADHLIYLPYLMGERSPHADPNARGVFFGLSAVHNRSHLIRAVMEGVAFSQRDCLGVFEEMGISAREMLVCGGGARSRLWRQILADVYHSGVSTLQNEEGPAMGAAILAGVGAGIFESVEKACAYIMKTGSTLEYNKRNAAKYDQYYKIYQDLYVHLRGDFAALSQI